jgi:hypothetical protein
LEALSKSNSLFLMAIIALTPSSTFCFFGPICNDKFDFMKEWCRTHNEPIFAQCEIKPTFVGRIYADNSSKIWLDFEPDQFQ